MVIQVVCWVDLSEQRRLCLIFCENMDPDKWDTTVWYRVNRNPQEFRGLTGYQRDPRILGVTESVCAPFSARPNWRIRTKYGLLAKFIYQNIYKKKKNLGRHSISYKHFQICAEAISIR